MRLKNTIITAILIFSLPMLPFLLTAGNKTKLNPPSKAKEQSYSDTSEYSDITLSVLHNGSILKVPVFNYICSVVASEMPPSYEPEALKAQAVAALSYTAYRINAQREAPGLFPEHNGADTCSDPQHCKGYCTKEELMELWGDSFLEYYGKIEAAVSNVMGLAITYNSEPINAVFHAISSGKTESSENVWGSKTPYLISVDSSKDTQSDGYLTEATFTEKEFLKIIEDYCGKEHIGITIENIKTTPAGTVTDIDICNTTLTGAQVREMFGLRSACFDIIQNNSSVVFKVRGYGHGVGMSQYGANELAKEGKSYADILNTYYPNTQIEQYDFSELLKN